MTGEGEPPCHQCGHNPHEPKQADEQVPAVQAFRIGFTGLESRAIEVCRLLRLAAKNGWDVCVSGNQRGTPDGFSRRVQQCPRRTGHSV